MRLHLVHAIRPAVTVGVACGIAMAMGSVRGADLAAAIAAPLSSSATPQPATPPALLPQAADAHPAPQSAAVTTAPARHGLRFPARILLLSGAKADDPRSFIVLGETDGERSTQNITPAGEPATERSSTTAQAATAQTPATVAETPAADRPATPALTAQPVPAPIDRGADPLAGSPPIDPSVTGGDAEKILANMLPPRTDSAFDWFAPLEPLHFCGEPRALAPCVPQPPCHPALPSRPFDLVGQRGTPTCGPIYGGPCDPRSGTCHDGPLAPFHRACDRLFDRFYTPR